MNTLSRNGGLWIAVGTAAGALVGVAPGHGLGGARAGARPRHRRRLHRPALTRARCLRRAAASAARRPSPSQLAMADKKAFLLRVDPGVWTAILRLAQAELRSMNAEIEFLLRDALARRGIVLEETRGETAGAPRRRRLSPDRSALHEATPDRARAFGLGEDAREKRAYRLDLLPHDRMRHRVRMPFDAIARGGRAPAGRLRPIPGGPSDRTFRAP